MSGYENWSDDNGFENDAESQGGGGLRKLLEQTLSENKKLREAIEGKGREDTATALLKDRGINPALAELIPKDVDPKDWVEQYAPLLGTKATTDADKPADEPDVQTPDDSDPAVQLRQSELAQEQRALADIQDAAESGLPASVHDDLLSRMDKINTEEELLAFFQQNGAPLD